MPVGDLKVRVRMYRQGLGDCFLLRFSPANGKPFHMLIDCGVLGNSHKDSDTMNQVAEDICHETGGHLDLVVATHRHWDHLSGFLQAQSVFDGMTIDRVWAPWTEGPKGTDRWKNVEKGLKALQSALRTPAVAALSALPAALPATPNDTDDDDDAGAGNQAELARRSAMWSGIHNLLTFLTDPDVDASDTALGVAGTPGVMKDPGKAMRYILGKGKSKQFMKPSSDGGKADPPVQVEGVEGVRFYVLGPPSADAYLRHDEPLKRDPKNIIYDNTQLAIAESFIAAIDVLTAAGQNPQEQLLDGQDQQIRPFDKRYVLDPQDYRYAMDDSATKKYYERYCSALPPGEEWRSIKDEWLDVAGELALWLDSYVNNTSLALAIELIESEQVFIFAADAQIGNWESWYDLEWEVKDKNGITQKVNIQRLFEKTTLYKVGHHGSHNATLREKGLVQMSNSALTALISVNEDTAHGQITRWTPKGWQMPADELLGALREKTHGRVLQADKPIPLAADLGQLSPTEVTMFESATDPQPLWIDINIQG